MAAEEVYSVERVMEHGPEIYAGTDLDVRAVVARMPHEVKEHVLLDRVPWHRFPHAYGTDDSVPRGLAALRSDDPAQVERALGSLWSTVCHQGATSPSGALAVPFLLRAAADPSAHGRAGTLELVAELARPEHFGDGTRAGLLRSTEDRVLWDNNGYLVHWSVEAARDAVAADADILLSLLDDPVPDIRSPACYALATASGAVGRISAALHDRFRVEEEPAVRASLVLAIGQLARERADGHAVAWTRGLWSDPARPAEVRVGGALAWWCLVDDPVPAELRAVLDDVVTDDTVRLMADVPWMRAVDEHGAGLTRCVARMLRPDARPVVAPDPSV
ncbi:HEAT repeat domain-containing protein [Nocardiopsis aegyptia]|uniref:HEAT repeat domain-containing protein n=1 Tax=Nocardiopsis aegyptia TaxID=220378 RepID=A0A7Z0EMX2_9ACTN|nr:HEAT repeat domain-containing protein [Nocardiopsis aegyptia]NYJ34824.1 hypothetical protein [Nocardiopsis aegyptia]